MRGFQFKPRVHPRKSLVARRVAIAVLLGFSLSIFAPRANAMTENTRILVRGGTYGLIGGTVVGLAVLPLTGSTRGVFIGSSLGLYVGLLMGVYDITHRNDPNNPFAMDYSEPATELDKMAFQSTSPIKSPPPPLLDFSIPVVTF
jgi:hypothetical protein